MNMFKWISGLRSANGSVPDTTSAIGTDLNLLSAARAPHSRSLYHSQDRTSRLEASHVVAGRHTPKIEQILANSNIERKFRDEQNGGGVMWGSGRTKSFHVGLGGMDVVTQLSLSSCLVQESSSVTDSGHESEGGAFGAMDGVGMGVSERSGDETHNVCVDDDVGDLNEIAREQSDGEEYWTAVTEWSADECSLVERPLSTRRLERRWRATMGSENLCEGHERECKRDGSARCFRRIWRRSKNAEDRHVETSTDVFEQCGPSKVRYRNPGDRRAVLKEGFMEVCKVFRGRTRSSFSRT